MIPEWQQGTVTRIEQATHNTRRYWISLNEPFHFKAGQFVTIDLPIHEQRNKRWRSYSIASAPDGTNEIELIIVLAEPSLGGSKYFFEEVKEGTALTLRGPQGLFTLPEHPEEEDIYLICTGTGIAPFRSMLWDVYRNNLPHGNLHLIFGCRTQQDLLYHGEMMELSSKLAHFYYHPTLSRENWEGLTGYVHPIYERFCEHCKPAHFMLCGWRVMVDEARERLAKLGYDRKRIHLELYG